MCDKRKTTCDEFDDQPQKKVKPPIAGATCLTDLPTELVLLVCHYLTPVQVLESFLDCNKHLYRCISDYHQMIDLRKCSCRDFSYYMMLFQTKRIQPSTVIISNAQLINQVEIFLERVVPSITYGLDHIRHLSLLECPVEKFFSINSDLRKFKSLKTLQIVEKVSKDEELPTSYTVLEELTYFIFYNPMNMLSELYLITNDGLILGKQLPPNEKLRYMTISLQNVNDLYLLLDGLVPNLIAFNVTLCESDGDQRFLFPRSWPHQSMFYLREFQLTTTADVEFRFDQLCDIVKPLIQLKTLTLYIRRWVSDDQRFVEGIQIDRLFEKCLPQLEHFFCSIRTICNIDMQTFSILKQRWPMKCSSESNSCHKHLYTIPWSFKQLKISMLADDDANSICPNVQCLTLDMSSTSAYLLRRFPHIDSLTILPECHLFHDDDLAFRQLRHLTMKNLNVVPSEIIRRVDTLTLFDVQGLSTHERIYPKMKYINLKTNRSNSFATVQNLIRHFPNLRLLEVQLVSERNAEYYDSLNVILDGEHLPHLLLLKTNWIYDTNYNSKVSLWISSKTSMKWRSTLFCAYHHEDQLTICL